MSLPQSEMTVRTPRVEACGWTIATKDKWMCKGSTTKDPLGTGEPRIFHTHKAATIALTAWLKGQWMAPQAGREVEYRTDRERYAMKARVVPVHIRYMVHA